MSPSKLRRATAQLVRLGFVLLICLGISSPALAAERLVEELPDGHNAMVAVDFTELRSSPFFAPAVQWITNHPAVGPQLQALESTLGIEVAKDLESLALVSDTPPLSADMLANPMAAVSSGAESSEGMIVLIRGDLDSAELIGRLAGDEDDGEENKYLRHGEMDLHFIDEKTIAVAIGQSSYRDAAKSRLQDRSGPGSVFSAAFSTLGSGQGLYLMTKPELDAEAREMTTPASFAAAAISLSSDVRLSVFMTMDTAEDAEKSAKDFEKLRKEAAANPLLGMFGLGPVVKNLSIRQQEKEVVVRTSMTNAEAGNLMRQALRIMSTSQQLGTPLGEEPKPDEPEPAVPRDGVDADFN